MRPYNETSHPILWLVKHFGYDDRQTYQLADLHKRFHRSKIANERADLHWKIDTLAKKIAGERYYLLNDALRTIIKRLD